MNMIVYLHKNVQMGTNVLYLCIQFTNRFYILP